MTERNLCVESSCHGLCCQNIDLELTVFEQTRLFPSAKKVATVEELAKLKSKTPSLYFTDYQREGLEGEGFVLLTINGPCPNRAEDGSCTVHAEREHAARNFKIGGDGCNAIRVENYLPAIFFEEVE